MSAARRPNDPPAVPAQAATAIHDDDPELVTQEPGPLRTLLRLFYTAAVAGLVIAASVGGVLLWLTR